MNKKIAITVRCIGCGKKKVVGLEQRDQPTCDECFMPMIAVGARA